MKTNKLNIRVRYATTLLLVFFLISAFFVSGLYAKYTDKVYEFNTASVAKIRYSIYDGNANTFMYGLDNQVLLPNTWYCYVYTFSVSNTLSGVVSDVAFRYNVTLSLENTARISFNGTSTNKLSGYPAVEPTFSTPDLQEDGNITFSGILPAGTSESLTYTVKIYIRTDALNTPPQHKINYSFNYEQVD